MINRIQPPRTALWILKRLISEQDRSYLYDELLSDFNYFCKDKGKIKRILWFWKQLCKSLPAMLLEKAIWSFIMFKNYLKIAFRNIRKNKVYSFINITGLTIGIVCCILILLWVQNELSYDGFHKNSDRIYRIVTDEHIGGQSSKDPVVPVNISIALDNDFPEIEKYVRLVKLWRGVTLEKGDRKFYAKYAFMVDPSFFDIFTVPVLYGDVKTSLKNPGTCVLSRSSAVKYFGEENIVGKTLMFERYGNMVVTAVTEDMPENSHFHFDILQPIPVFNRPASWLFANCFTYILLKENVSPDQIESKFPYMVRKYFAPEMEERWKTSYKEFTDSGGYIKHSLQRLDDIYLRSNMDFELEQNSDIKYIHIFLSAAFFIMLVACINYVNLSTAVSTGRMKEIAVRKVVGSYKILLIKQFLTESLLLSLISGTAAAVLAWFLLPVFNDFSGKHLELNFFGNPLAVISLVLAVTVSGVLAGIYPAFFLTTINPVSLLKGSYVKGIKKSSLKKGYVTIQLAITIILIISTLVVTQQLKYILERDLGFDEKNILVINNASGGLERNFDAFKNDLIQYTNIINAAGASSTAGRVFSSEVFYPEDKTAQEGIYFFRLGGGYELLETMKLDIIQGRYFSRDFSTDSLSIVINETAAKRLGWENPVGKRISMANIIDYNIIGVVKDFNYHSLYKHIEPIAIMLNENFNYLMLIRIDGEDPENTLAFVKEKWDSYTSGKLFDYYFLENNIENIYKSERSARILLFGFSAIVIFLTCMGLYGMITFVTAQRTKEIGIRKTFGASTVNIVNLFIKNLAAWLLIANIIAFPAAYFIANRWLQNFAYRINIGWNIFFLSGLFAFVIAFFTVIFQTLKAASATPVDSLKCE
ncbi:ABC transporter permease [candidate division KSB1 bacterium]